jgi:hypothetical protein
MGRFDFEPMTSFLRARLPEHRPVYTAATKSNLAAFMSALRNVGDGQLNHDIAGELERLSQSVPPS